MKGSHAGTQVELLHCSTPTQAPAENRVQPLVTGRDTLGGRTPAHRQVGNRCDAKPAIGDGKRVFVAIRAAASIFDNPQSPRRYLLLDALIQPDHAVGHGHDGKLWVESEPGAGSHFKFTLRSVDAPQSAREVAAHSDAALSESCNR